MKTKYYFDLIQSCIPEMKGGVLIKDSNVGGTKNSYNVYKVYYVTLFKKYEILLYKRFLGRQAFLRPYKKLWSKRVLRLPKLYWGKDPILINMWLTLIGDYDKLKKTIGKTSVLAYDSTTQSAIINIFHIPFESKLIKKNLQSNKSFSINQKN